MGVKVEKHHHEVAPSQHRLGTLLIRLTKVMVCKFTNMRFKTSLNFGKTATFMPKPVKGDNGSGMHT